MRRPLLAHARAPPASVVPLLAQARTPDGPREVAHNISLVQSLFCSVLPQLADAHAVRGAGARSRPIACAASPHDALRRPAMHSSMAPLRAAWPNHALHGAPMRRMATLRMLCCSPQSNVGRINKLAAPPLASCPLWLTAPCADPQAGVAHGAVRPESFEFHPAGALLAAGTPPPVVLSAWRASSQLPVNAHGPAAGWALRALARGGAAALLFLPPEALWCVARDGGVSRETVARAAISPEADIFGLGLTAWCLLLGGPLPYGAASMPPALALEPGVVAAHALVQLQRGLGDHPLWALLPRDLREALAWALEPRPRLRATADELVRCAFTRAALQGAGCSGPLRGKQLLAARACSPCARMHSTAHAPRARQLPVSPPLSRPSDRATPARALARVCVRAARRRRTARVCARGAHAPCGPRGAGHDPRGWWARHGQRRRRRRRARGNRPMAAGGRRSG